MLTEDQYDPAHHLSRVSRNRQFFENPREGAAVKLDPCSDMVVFQSPACGTSSNNEVPLPVGKTPK
jgi:hypothetical protein